MNKSLSSRVESKKTTSEHLKSGVNSKQISTTEKTVRKTQTTTRNDRLTQLAKPKIKIPDNTKQNVMKPPVRELVVKKFNEKPKNPTTSSKSDRKVKELLPAVSKVTTPLKRNILEKNQKTVKVTESKSIITKSKTTKLPPVTTKTPTKKTNEVPAKSSGETRRTAAREVMNFEINEDMVGSHGVRSSIENTLTVCSIPIERDAETTRDDSSQKIFVGGNGNGEPDMFDCGNNCGGQVSDLGNDSGGQVSALGNDCEGQVSELGNDCGRQVFDLEDEDGEQAFDREIDVDREQTFDLENEKDSDSSSSTISVFKTSVRPLSETKNFSVDHRPFNEPDKINGGPKSIREDVDRSIFPDDKSGMVSLTEFLMSKENLEELNHLHEKIFGVHDESDEDSEFSIRQSTDVFDKSKVLWWTKQNHSRIKKSYETDTVMTTGKYPKTDADDDERDNWDQDYTVDATDPPSSRKFTPRE